MPYGGAADFRQRSGDGASRRGTHDLARAPLRSYLKWLAVPDGGALRVLAAAEISYLRADQKYTTIVTPHSAFLLTSSLRQMKEKLDPQMFWQIHRGVVVNVGSIDRIDRSFRGALEVKVKGREELLPVSAVHAHLFTSRADGHM